MGTALTLRNKNRTVHRIGVASRGEPPTTAFHVSSTRAWIDAGFQAHASNYENLLSPDLHEGV